MNKTVLLNGDFQRLAMGPCTIEFVNSSREKRTLVVLAGSRVTRKRLSGFRMSSLLVAAPVEAVFRLTPCDEATAKAAIERMIPAPVKILALVETKQIPAGHVDNDEMYSGDDDDDEF